MKNLVSALVRMGLGALVLLVAGCPSDGPPIDDDTSQQVADLASEFIAEDVPADLPPPPDPTIEMFDPNRVLEISIELAPEDWEELRHQTRSFLDVIGSTCLEEPAPRPYTYFPASVTIDGEENSNVAVRKKAFFGSLSTTKPGLKVKFNEYVKGQSYKGLKRLTLNNSISDLSYVKQCLGYEMFRRAGVPAARCNFAAVTVNGQYMGLYVHVESMKKQFLNRHFGSDSGNLYEGALSDFREGWVNTFQKKTNKKDPDRSDIEALVSVLELPDEQLLAELDALIDIDEFVSFWATELLVLHVDGYARNTNNFYMYRDPADGRFSFIPWGIDSILYPEWVWNVGPEWEEEPLPGSVWAVGALARRLYLHPETQPLYLERLTELLETIWDEEWLDAEVDRMTDLILPYLSVAEMEGFNEGLSWLRLFIKDRRGYLAPILAAGPEEWNLPLRDPWCVDTVGQLEATFSTSWDTLEAENPFWVGEGTLEVTMDDGTDFVAVNIGATAGMEKGEQGDEPSPAINIIAWLNDDTAIIVGMRIVEEAMVPGAHEIDWSEVSGFVVHIIFVEGQEEPDLEIVGMVGEGTLQLDEVSMEKGAPISGTISSIIYEPFF